MTNDKPKSTAGRFFQSLGEIFQQSSEDDFTGLEELQEREARLDEARRSFEIEHSQTPPEEFYHTPCQVLSAAVQKYQWRLEQILATDIREGFLDVYITGTKANQYKEHKILFNYATKFPGIQAEIDRILEE